MDTVPFGRMADVKITDRLKVPDEVVVRDLGGDTVILQLETGVYFSVDEVGTEIWKDVQSGATLQACFDRLLSEYAVEAEVLRGDIIRFAQQLVTKGLAVVAR